MALERLLRIEAVSASTDGRLRKTGTVELTSPTDCCEVGFVTDAFLLPDWIKRTISAAEHYEKNDQNLTFAEEATAPLPSSN